MLVRLLLAAFLLIASAARASAGPLRSLDPVAGTADDTEEEARLRVFLDCSVCDFDHIRREVPFVDYVRDAADAQVHVLVTTRGAGMGGREYLFHFIGRRDFAGVDDTLRFVSSATDTPAEVREAIAHNIKLGLVRYLVRTEAATRLRVTYSAPLPTTRPQATARDSWNYWAFRTRAAGSFNAERSRSTANFDGSLSANRTTEIWRSDVSTWGNFRRRRDELSTGTVRTVRHSWNVNGLLVRSLGGHWSAGAITAVSSSTFANQRLAIRLAPAVEYSLFPYEESSRRQLFVRYSMGVQHVDWYEETIFEETEETRINEGVSVAYAVNQPWGRADFSLQGSHYLHDAALYRVDLATGWDVRLFRGLSLSLDGRASRIQDQIGVPRADPTDEEILLGQRQQATSYRYSGSLGVSYTFGSMFQNVVNPRLRGGF